MELKPSAIYVLDHSSELASGRCLDFVGFNKGPERSACGPLEVLKDSLRDKAAKRTTKVSGQEFIGHDWTRQRQQRQPNTFVAPSDHHVIE